MVTGTAAATMRTHERLRDVKVGSLFLDPAPVTA